MVIEPKPETPDQLEPSAPLPLDNQATEIVATPTQPAPGADNQISNQPPIATEQPTQREAPVATAAPVASAPPTTPLANRDIYERKPPVTTAPTQAPLQPAPSAQPMPPMPPQPPMQPLPPQETPQQAQAAEQAQQARAANDSGKLRVVLGDQPVFIGSSRRNTLFIPDTGVAPLQARIEHDQTGEYTLTALARGVYINGIAVQQAVLLPGAELRIGRHRFIFTGKELHQYDAEQEVRVDAIDLTETRRVGLLGLHRKVLLDDISISLLPGSFVAIVGASGAGKSTLLRALSGQQPADKGTVLYNGLTMLTKRHHFCTSMGYVPQDDIVHKNLTVESALTYEARLRLPESYSHQQIADHVRWSLAAVELTEQRHQLISHLSGGQRKRVNIALELLGRPAIFYLDEPTAGLDPGLDAKMMQLLRRLADGGQTVALVTHATANIDMCDYVCFLAPNGRLAYYGPPEKLKQHFRTDNYAEMYNALYADPDRWVALFRQSPDYLQYVEGLRVQSENIAQAESEQAPKDALKAPTNAAVNAPVNAPMYTAANAPMMAAGQAPAAMASSMANPAINPAAPAQPAPKTDKTGDSPFGLSTECASNPLRQFWLLTLRYLDLTIHDPINLLILLAQAPIIALLIVLLADKSAVHQVMSPPNPLTHTDYSAQRTLFIMVCSAIWFGIVNAAREIVKEAPIYRRERAVNLRIIPYIFSKIVVLGLLCAIQDAALLLIVGAKVGYPTRGLIWPGQGGAFAEMYISLLLMGLVGVLLGLFISALAPTSDRAMSLVPLALIPQIIFANVIFTLTGTAGKIISYLTPSRWGMQAMGATVRLNNTYAGMGDTPFYKSDVPHLLGFWLALVALAVLFFILTLLAQRSKDELA